MNQNLIKNGLIFKTLGGGKKNIINNTINKNIANELNDCTLSSVTEYYKKKKIRNLQYNNKHHNNNNILNGPKATFYTMLNEYKIIIHLNGITRRDIKLDLVGNYFIILCEKTKNGLDGNEMYNNNKFCYYKKSFKLPNDSEPESMQAKLFEDRLEISINRINNLQNSPPLSTSNENENHYNKDIDREEKINVKKKNAISETNIVQLIPSKKIKKFTSDTNLFYCNNKNKIFSINPSSFSNHKKILSKLNQLEFSSILPQNNMLRKKSISEQDLNHKKENASITTSSSLFHLPVQNITNSGWTLVTRRRQNKRSPNLLPSLESQNKSKNNPNPYSFSSPSSPRNSIDNLMKPLKPKSHYRDPNNLYSPLYISSDSSMAFSDSQSSKNSLRGLSNSFILLRKSISSTFSSSSNNNILKERSSSSSKDYLSSNKKLNNGESHLSLSKSKESINKRNLSSLKENLNQNINNHLSSKEDSKKTNDISLKESTKKLNDDISAIENLIKTIKNQNSKENEKIIIKNKDNLRTIQNQSSKENLKPFDKQESIRSLHQFIIDNINKSILNHSESRNNSNKDLTKNPLIKQKSTLSDFNKSSHSKTLHSNVNSVGSPTKKESKPLLTSQKSKLSRSNTPIFKNNNNKNTNRMGTNSNSNSNTNKLLYNNSHSFKGINTKPSFNHSHSINKIDTKPLFDSSSNNYESLRQKVLKSLNESLESRLSNKKTPKNKSISNYTESKGQSHVKPSSIQNENKSLLIPSPLTSTYNEARKNSLIPTPSECTSSKRNSVLKVITKPNNNNSFSIKKSKIPISPTSKSALNRIDSLIKNSLFTQNIISTY